MRAAEAAAPARLRLRHAATVLALESAAPGVLEWLHEFVAPAFEPVDEGTPRQTVVFRADAEHHLRLSAEAPPAARAHTLDGLTFDGHFSRPRAWTAAGGETRALDDLNGLAYRIDAGRRHVEIVAPRDDGWLRLGLVRVVRELASSAALEAGLLPLHGAAFAGDGGATLLCGEKNAGKTSLLVHALLGGAAFIANDRLVVDTATAAVRGVPTVVTIRNGTMALFPELARAYAAARFDRGRTIAACAPGIERPEPEKPRSKDRPGLSPPQLCHLIGAPMAAGGRAGRVLLPRLDAAARGIGLRRLDLDAAAAALRGNLLRASTPLRTSALFATPAGPLVLDPERERRACEQLARVLPVYECTLGPDAYETDLLALLAAA